MRAPYIHVHFFTLPNLLWFDHSSHVDMNISSSLFLYKHILVKFFNAYFLRYPFILINIIRLIYYLVTRQHGLLDSMHISLSQTRTTFAKLCIVLYLVCVMLNFLSELIQSLHSVLLLKHAQVRVI
jgi:hypothetical protein